MARSCSAATSERMRWVASFRSMRSGGEVLMSLFRGSPRPKPRAVGWRAVVGGCLEGQIIGAGLACPRGRVRVALVLAAPATHFFALRWRRCRLAFRLLALVGWRGLQLALKPRRERAQVIGRQPLLEHKTVSGPG